MKSSKILFESLILKLQNLRRRKGVHYEEDCQKEINKIGQIILDLGLLDKQDDIVFSEQLLMMNCVPEKYWRKSND